MSSYRIVVIGATSAGKSGIAERYVLGTFVSEYGPTIDEIYQKKIQVDSKTCSLDIVDVSGLEEYSTLAEEHMKTGDGFIISYCINSRGSFSHASKVRSALLRVKDNIADIPIVLTGNKSDLDKERTISTQEGQKLAAEWDCPFFETSAKEDKNVSEAFTELIHRIDAYRDRHPPVVEVPQKKRERAPSRGWRKSASASVTSPKLNNSAEDKLPHSPLSSSSSARDREKEKESKSVCVLL